MSQYYGKHGKPEEREYVLHGRTKQSQKDECDINKLLERSAKHGALSHLEKYQPFYGDFSGYDFETHIKNIARGNTIFEELPAEVKKEFDQSAQKFFEFVTKPENADKLPQLLPAIAKQGDYFPPIGVTPSLPAEQGPRGAQGAASGAQGSEATENTSPPAPEDTPPSEGG